MASLMGTDAGYIEDASFVKLRELSLTLLAPNDWARRVGSTNLSLTLAGRNLATWTDYTGFDPELNFNGTRTSARPISSRSRRCGTSRRACRSTGEVHSHRRSR